MDELRGPNIQIVLHVKEGLGFGFLRTPFVVSGSLNGYMLETDPVIPCHAPVFDAELVWEADKRRFRSLRVQNVPIKVEVYSMGTQGRKDKIGYLLLSLLGAQPCPSNKIIDVKHSWQKLLGVKSEGKCCHPQLMMSLSIEDRINTPTPRNELRMFHSNEVAYLSALPKPLETGKLLTMTLNEYIEASKKKVSKADLQPRLLCEEGLIQIGEGKSLFVLSFVIGAVENLDMLLHEDIASDAVDCYITYNAFTHSVMTDRVAACKTSENMSAQFNQRTSLKLRCDLSSLGRYLAECPLLVIKLCAGDQDVGICSTDLRKLVPTDDVKQFTSSFCNNENLLKIHERCFILRFKDESVVRADSRRPYLDVEMVLKYVGTDLDVVKPSHSLTARSAAQLESDINRTAVEKDLGLDYKSGSCTHLDQNVGQRGYTNMAAANTARYKNASGDPVIQTTEIAEMIRRMCESFTLSQEKILASANFKPLTSDMQVQCEPEVTKGLAAAFEKTQIGIEDKEIFRSEPVMIEKTKSDTCVTARREKDTVKMVLSATDRDSIMQRFVEELEDWKEKQQELYKCQLKRKEEYHLELLAKEWARKRMELECKLSKGIEQCRTLALDLSRATDDFRLRGYRNTEREKKLADAKKALESHYTTKYQDLREASQKMEDDMNHQLRLKDMKIKELETRCQHLEKQVDIVKNNMKNIEKESESRYSGLTKDQTASLIQELRCLEEKLDSAVQSKAFFKEQWGRAVRELHLIKLNCRKQMLSQLKHDRSQLSHDMGLEPIEDLEKSAPGSFKDIKKMKDDFYVDLLANTPALDSHSNINNSGPGGLEMFDDVFRNTPKNHTNEKLTELITQRDKLIRDDIPDERAIKQLNNEIRNMLLNCGT